MEWVKSKQITDEQKLVLKALAQSVGKPSLNFLEVGSWLGESTLVLAEVAKKHFGKVYCVDWWKGNIGTELETLASKEDIFALFWQRICQEGFEDVVIPIRSSSDAAAEILRDQTFDLIFIDGDHRHDQTLRDIRHYASFVKPNGGILSGHDCEGYISDFNEDFLNQGKDIDSHETVHCGVVLAVGSTFKDYSINHSIWSLASEPENRTWHPIHLDFQGVSNTKQSPPPLLGTSDNFNIFRYGKRVFAIPKEIDGFDAKWENQPTPSTVVTEETLDDLEERIGERIWISKESPVLLSAYRKFNLVEYKDKIYALHESIGPIDLTLTPEQKIKQYKNSGKCFLEKSLKAIKKKIDSSIPILVEENYRKFNIVFYRGQYIAVAQDLGKIKNWNTFDFKSHNDTSKCFTGESHIEVLRFVDQLSLQSMEKDIKQARIEIKKSQSEIRDKNSHIATLEKKIKKSKTPVKSSKKKTKSRAPKK